MNRFGLLVGLTLALPIGWLLGFATYDLASEEVLPVSAWTADWVGALGQWAGAIGGVLAAIFAAGAWRAASSTLNLERGRDRATDNRDLRGILAWTVEPTGVSGTARERDVSYRWVVLKVEVANNGTAPLYELRVGLSHCASLRQVSDHDVARIDLLLPGASKQLELSWRGAQQALGQSDQTISPAVSFSDVEESRWTYVRGRLLEEDLVPDPA